MSFPRAIADDWWARDFACAGHELRPARTRVQQHTGALSADPGIWILVAGGAPLISLPADTFAALRALAQGWSAADVADVARLQQQLSPVCPRLIDRTIGPAFIAYGSADSLDLSDARFAQPISSHADARRLRDACQPEEWEHGGSESEPAFGVIDRLDGIVALAGYQVHNESIAHISVVTHPLHRGRGHGRAAVALAAQHALGAGLLPQYRTLRQNRASLEISARLGFVEYGFSVYIRLGAASAARTP
jgi:GNAT superfamily N-acetyltransferase